MSSATALFWRGSQLHVSLSFMSFNIESVLGLDSLIFLFNIDFFS